MSDPKRLRLGDDLGAALLSSAADDAPPAGARDRMKSALGVAAVGVSAGLAATTTTKVATAAAKTASLAWLKLAGVVLVGTTVTATVVATRTSPSDSPTETRPTAAKPSSSSVAPSVVETTWRPAPVETTTAPAETPITIASAAAAAEPPLKPQSAAARPAPTDPLTQELALLDGARASLASSRPRAALEALDRFDRAFPRASLRVEASVLRAEALLAAGDRDGARKLARALLAREPSGPHAKRLSSIAAAE